MNDTHRSIFRTDAIRRYTQRRAESVLPRLVAPRAFLTLWLLLGALIACGFLTWLARVPAYAAGTAVVIDWRDGHMEGMITGLAGIGYGLLRIAEPGRVPAVLVLEAPL